MERPHFLQGEGRTDRPKGCPALPHGRAGSAPPKSLPGTSRSPGSVPGWVSSPGGAEHPPSAARTNSSPAWVDSAPSLT